MDVDPFVCAGCGEPATASAKVNCTCETNVLFRLGDANSHAIKDRYFLSQIDTAGAQWAQIKADRDVNLGRVMERNGGDGR